jgi:hypothetical protein
MDTPLHVVTGAFGYSGSYIASRLLDTGVRVRTITNSLSRPSPLKGRIEAHPFNFDRPERLVDSLRGASVLYNTYWMRFNATGFRHSVAVAQGSSRESVVINAIGPETFTYRSLVETIGEAIGRVRPIVSIPPFVGYGVGWALGHLLGDVVITRPEIEGLMAGPPFRQRTASGHNTALNLGRDPLVRPRHPLFQ